MSEITIHGYTARPGQHAFYWIGAVHVVAIQGRVAPIPLKGEGVLHGNGNDSPTTIIWLIGNTALRNG